MIADEPIYSITSKITTTEKLYRDFRRIEKDIEKLYWTFRSVIASSQQSAMPLESTKPEADNPADAQTELVSEYDTETDNPLVKILDHTDQLPTIRNLLNDIDSDRMIALVEANAHDWPSYLADHVYLEFGPKHNQNLQGVVSLRLTRFDGKAEAFWEALIPEVPGTRPTADKMDNQAAVRDWIKSAGLGVLYLAVDLERYGRHLPEIIRGANETLAGLGDFVPGTQVLVIIACLRNAGKAPFWWPWYARFKLAGLEYCHRLKAMRPLEKADIVSWHAGFPHRLRAHYDRDRLMAELFKLFPPDGRGIRYEQARSRLIDEGALQRARRKPRPGPDGVATTKPAPGGDDP